MAKPEAFLPDASTFQSVSAAPFPFVDRLSKSKRRTPHDRTLRREVIDVPFVESSVPRCVGHAPRGPDEHTLESLKRFDTPSERETDFSAATRANPPPRVCRSVLIIAVASHERDASGRVFAPVDKELVVLSPRVVSLQPVLLVHTLSLSLSLSLSRRRWRRKRRRRRVAAASCATGGERASA